ncbi:MAG TPA: YIP1 family protein [Candidatus Krumholzibacteria bacterium]
MSFFRRFGAIFFSPYQVFDDIRDARVSWWQPWLMVSVLMMVATALSLPAQTALLENNPDLAGAENAAKMVKITQYVQLALSPVLVLLFAVIMTAVSYVVVTLVSKEATFKKYFTLILFTDVVAIVGYVVTSILLRARGFDQIASPEDMKVGLSLRLLAPDASPVVKGLLGGVEFFAVWGFTLAVLGLRRVFGLALGAAIACSIPLWLIYMALAVVGELMQKGP